MPLMKKLTLPYIGTEYSKQTVQEIPLLIINFGKNDFAEK